MLMQLIKRWQLGIDEQYLIKQSLSVLANRGGSEIGTVGSKRDGELLYVSVEKLFGTLLRNDESWALFPLEEVAIVTLC